MLEPNSIPSSPHFPLAAVAAASCFVAIAPTLPNQPGRHAAHSRPY